MTTKPHRLEIAAQLMAGLIAHYGKPDNNAQASIHEYPVTVIVEPETPEDVG